MNAVPRLPLRSSTLLGVAAALTLPQLVFYQAILLHQLWGVGGLYDTLLVRLDTTLLGKAVTVLCMLGLPLAAVALAALVFRAEPRLRSWSAGLALANLGLMAIIVSYLVVESLHEVHLG